MASVGFRTTILGNHLEASRASLGLRMLYKGKKTVPSGFPPKTGSCFSGAKQAILKPTDAVADVRRLCRFQKASGGTGAQIWSSLNGLKRRKLAGGL